LQDYHDRFWLLSGEIIQKIMKKMRRFR